MRILKLLVLVTFITISENVFSSANDQKFSGFVRVRADRELYVEYEKPRPGQPTVILLNGLTYSTRQFETYARALSRRGLGVLRFDFDGMGQTLLRHIPSTFTPFSYEQQVSDLRTLLMNLRIPGPFHFAGLSYGGGIAAAYGLMYPNEVASLILIAPFTQPLESQDSWIRSQIWLTRRTFPMNPATDDQLYDYFLKQIIYSTYPQAEPIVLENPFKLEAVYNLVRGIRKFRAIDYAQSLPQGTIHLVVGGMDQYIPASVMENFWNRTNPTAKMSRIVVHGSEHKVTEAFPEFMAGWTLEILRKNPNLFQGNTFEGFPYGMVARSGQIQIQLTK